jgi:DNA-binding response OmpR family regulator
VIAEARRPYTPRVVRCPSCGERSELLRDVWGYEDAGGSNVIEANVRSLRRKLGDRAASIETVRGLGYRFHAAS